MRKQPTHFTPPPNFFINIYSFLRKLVCCPFLPGGRAMKRLAPQAIGPRAAGARADRSPSSSRPVGPRADCSPPSPSFPSRHIIVLAFAGLSLLALPRRHAAAYDRRRSQHPQIATKQSKISRAEALAAARARVEKVLHCPAKFIVSMCRDNVGNIWVGTEDRGVYRYNPSAPAGNRWKQFTTANGLGDNNAYALICDKQGRIWAGNLNHGVSVYNGKRWQNYDCLADQKKHVLAGPIGEHVVALAVDPLGHAIWMATNSGLAIYHPRETGRAAGWSYITTENGLPSDAVDAIAFGPRGGAYVGTECYGLVVLRPVGNRPAQGRGLGKGPWLKYRIAHVVSSQFRNSPPLTPVGRGLPSNLINAVLAEKKGTIWVGTDEGLAWSRNRGRSWRFVRGVDWRAKDQQLAHPVAPRVIAAAARYVPAGGLLSGDHVTCLNQGAGGQLWVGFWRSGIDVLNERTGKISHVTAHAAKPSRYTPQIRPHFDVSCLAPRRNGRMLVGFYGSGVQQWKDGPALAQGNAAEPEDKQSSAVALPVGAAVASPAQAIAERVVFRQAIAKRLRRDREPRVVPLDQDWITQGNWLGRYGTYWALLCAMGAPHDLLVMNGWRSDAQGWNALGPHCLPGDGLRSWVQWLYTANPRVLEMPKGYLEGQWLKGLAPSRRLDRRESEWDDHGEALPYTWQGPGIFCTINVPAGLYILGIYEFNKDGHAGNNRFRDYTVTVRPKPTKAPLNLRGFNHWRGAARQRVVNFWGGVWTRFLVRGPGQFAVKIGRNYSLNTIVQAFTFDLAVRRPPPFFTPITRRAALSMMNQLPPPPTRPHGRWPANVINLRLGMTEKLRHPPALTMYRWFLGSAHFASACRAALAARASGWREAVGRDAWILHRFAVSERQLRKQGFVPARQVEKSLSLSNPTFGFLAVPRLMRQRNFYKKDRAAMTKLAVKKGDKK